MYIYISISIRNAIKLPEVLLLLLLLLLTYVHPICTHACAINPSNNISIYIYLINRINAAIKASNYLIPHTVSFDVRIVRVTF